MWLYKLTQTEVTGWDTWDACIVAASSEEEAKGIHPRSEWDSENCWEDYGYGWASSPENVTATLIGETHSFLTPCVVLSSFNAG